jgi:hypothetical protein
MDPSGRIDNGSSTSISTAVDNGYELGPNLGVGEAFDFNIDDALVIYPNPATDVLKVTVISLNDDNNNNGISIYNYAGQLVHHFDLNVNNGSWNFEVDLSTYAKGLYSIEYKTSQSKVIKKFVVQ